MLTLIARHHVHRLLYQIEIEILIARTRRKVEISIDIGLRTRIEKRIYVRLIPTSLLYGLKLAVEVIEPLTYIALVRF